jgi:glycosyltransferase involved in cell wall biosynthesis
LAGKYYNHFFPKFAERADKIISVSNFTKDDLVRSYCIKAEKIQVAYNGSNAVFKPLEEEEKEKVRDHHTDGKEYFIYIGSLHPRKNIRRLFLAFDRFKEQTGSDMKLVIVGQKLFHTKQILKTYRSSNFRNDILFTGRIDNESLAALLASANALTLFSLFEGFGIPIIEAMNCQIPVLCSDVTSLPEVAGEAALYADPRSIDSMAQSMVRISRNQELREQLTARGKERTKLFDWDESARKIWNVIEKELIP